MSHTFALGPLVAMTTLMLIRSASSQTLVSTRALMSRFTTVLRQTAALYFFDQTSLPSRELNQKLQNCAIDQQLIKIQKL